MGIIPTPTSAEKFAPAAAAVQQCRACYNAPHQLESHDSSAAAGMSDGSDRDLSDSSEGLWLKHGPSGDGELKLRTSFGNQSTNLVRGTIVWADGGEPARKF